MNPFINRLAMFSHSLFAKYGQDIRIAVVGNGGLSPEDQAVIAGADCVIRFNNYATRAGIEYTSDAFRCDVLFTTGDLHSEGADPHSVVLGIPFPFNAAENARKMGRWYPSARSYMVNPFLNNFMVQELELWSPVWEKLPEKIDPRGWMHPFPSIGFTCLWHLHHLIGNVRDFAPNVFIAGFNWYSTNPGKKNQKIQDWDIRRVDYPKHWNHNYPKEVIWILDNLFRHDRFSFSESCWTILDTARQQRL